MYGTYFQRWRTERGLTEVEVVTALRKAGCPITLARYKRIERNQAEPLLVDALTLIQVLQLGAFEIPLDDPIFTPTPRRDSR